MKILTAGHACVDIAPGLDVAPGLEPGVLYGVGPLKLSLGGSAVNTGRKLHELGADIGMAVATGRDPLSLIYEAMLKETGIRVQLIATDLSASYSIVIEHSSHDRTFWQHEGFNAAFDPRDVDLGAWAPDLLHAGYPSLVPYWCHNTTVLADVFKSATSTGITTSLDLAHVADGSIGSTVNWKDWFSRTLPYVDVISPSWDDLTSAYGIHEEPRADAIRAMADSLIAAGAGVVQLSAGRHGFLIRTAGRERLQRGGAVVSPLAERWADQALWFDAERIQTPRTTVGAGDSLTAGLIHALGLGMDPREAGEFGRLVVGHHLRGEPLPPVGTGR